MKTVFSCYVHTERDGFYKKENTIPTSYSCVANKVRSILQASESLFHWSKKNIYFPKSHKNCHTFLNNFLPISKEILLHFIYNIFVSRGKLFQYFFSLFHYSLRGETEEQVFLCFYWFCDTK